MDLNCTHVRTFIRDILVPFMFENTPHADLVALSRTCKRLYRMISRWLANELTRPRWYEFPSKWQFREYTQKGALCIIAHWIDLGFVTEKCLKYITIADNLPLLKQALKNRAYFVNHFKEKYDLDILFVNEKKINFLCLN